MLNNVIGIFRLHPFVSLTGSNKITLQDYGSPFKIIRKSTYQLRWE